MKKLILQPWSVLLLLTLLVACDDDDDANDVTPAVTFEEMESEWVRISLMRENAIDLLQTNTGEIIHTISGDMTENARHYTSSSGRYLVKIDRAGNKVRFFDSGVINHIDHGHQNQPSWLPTSVDTPLPTHFSTSLGHMVIFNDGDGSITYVRESQLELPAYTPTVMSLQNAVKHHGAAFRLDNGKFAVTFRTAPALPEGIGLPQVVKFVNADGTVIDNNGGVEVTNIHGNATNGEYGVFGSTDGVILVDNQDNISLIENIGGLNSETGQWIGTVKSHDNSDLFFGRSRNFGVFVIDPEAQTMTSLYAGDDVAGDMMSFDGQYYVLHTTDGHVRVYNANDGTEVAERVVEMADIPALAATGRTSSSEIEVLRQMNEPSPVLICSDSFLYILAPNRRQIKVLDISDLTHVHTIELDNEIVSMFKNGFTEE